MQIRKRKCINKLFIPILYLQVSTSELSYFTEFIFGNCCIPTQIMEFCDKGFLYLLFFYCMLSSSEPYWKKMNIKFYQEEKGYGRVNIFQCLFLKWGKPEFLWSLLLRMKNWKFCRIYFCHSNFFLELDFAILGKIWKNKICKNCINLIGQKTCDYVLLCYYFITCYYWKVVSSK